MTGGPREFVRSVELSELCLLMCPSPRCGQLPAWAQFWVDIVMTLTLHFAKCMLKGCIIETKETYSLEVDWVRAEQGSQEVAGLRELCKIRDCT